VKVRRRQCHGGARGSSASGAIASERVARSITLARERLVSAYFQLVCDFEVLTPMFLGGASQEAELRAASIKGALRFWYRALDPAFKEHEPRLFGSGGKGAGQSILLLRCKEGQLWNTKNANQFVQAGGRQTQDGLVYLGYPFTLGGNVSRSAVAPGARFSVQVTCRRPAPGKSSPGVTPLRAALASTWALGHFGALGTRARRGFGAIALTDWRLEDRDGQPLPNSGDLTDLPLLHRTASTGDWMAGAQRGLDTIRAWFGRFEVGDSKRAHRHPHFGPRADFTIGKESARRSDWRSALSSLGYSLQKFRLRKRPDYEHVKDHVLLKMGNGGRRIQRAPNRATFGLPLTFRFSSIRNGPSVTFAPVNGERHGSLLFLRPVAAGETLFGLYLRLDGEIPGMDTRVRLLRDSGPTLEPAARNAMDEFLQEMKGKG
jgi:CRISPR-associated protein Cmr1